MLVIHLLHWGTALRKFKDRAALLMRDFFQKVLGALWGEQVPADILLLPVPKSDACVGEGHGCCQYCKELFDTYADASGRMYVVALHRLLCETHMNREV
eukprot:2506555-Amphidinium_carterae.1